jgi:hypothetical protein
VKLVGESDWERTWEIIDEGKELTDLQGKSPEVITPTLPPFIAAWVSASELILFGLEPRMRIT